MTLAVFPGSFDPVTNGHLDVVKRAAAVFDQVIVAVGVNPQKSGWLPVKTREELIRVAVSEQLPDASVLVVSFKGLLADLIQELGADAIVKGIRGPADLTGESAQAEVNFDLAGVETFLLPARGRAAFISSSLVREVALAGGPIDAYVPAAVVRALADSAPRFSDTSTPRSSDA